MIKAAQTLHSKTDYSFQATVKKKKKMKFQLNKKKQFMVKGSNLNMYFWDHCA